MSAEPITVRSGTSVEDLLDGLGAVQDHVRTAAEWFIRSFNLTSISGWRSWGADPNGHPAGLAIDIPAGRELGDRVAQAAITAHKALGIKNIIWQQAIWTPATGRWTPMPHLPGDTGSGYDPNHLRHVHIAFTAEGGDGKDPKLPNPDAGGDGIDWINALLGGTLFGQFWGRVSDAADSANPWVVGRALALQGLGVAAALALIVAGVWRVTEPARTKVVTAASEQLEPLT